MQFTFGVWQDQQLKQQQRSVISGSSNSFSNTATLRALRHMPVNLTTDRPAHAKAGVGGSSASGAGGQAVGSGSVESSVESSVGGPAGCAAESDVECAGEGEYSDNGSASAAEGDSADGSSSEDDFVSEKPKAPKNKSAPRRVSLRWPCPYSYSLQHIVGARYEGYYCPPLPKDGEDVPDKSAQDAGIFGVVGDGGSNKWMCIYREVSADSSDDSARKRQCVK